MASVSTSDGSKLTSTAASTIDVVSSALGPKSMSGDEGSVTERSISELIEADSYGKEADVMSKSSLPIRKVQIKPGGTI